MQACFSRVCSEMSSAKPVGCGRRQLAILALGGNRRSWVAGIGMRMRLADDDAVLVIDETGFLKQARLRAEWRGWPIEACPLMRSHAR